MLYFAVGEYGYEGGIQVTASHNPAAYNGMKIVRRGALPVGGDTRPRPDQGARARGELPPAGGAPAQRAAARRATPGFATRVLAFVDRVGDRARCNVVIDGANGMGGR